MVKQLCIIFFGIGWLIGLIVIGAIFLDNALLCTAKIDITVGITAAVLTWLLIPFGLWGITKGWIFPPAKAEGK